jgi:hypothetical protein
MRWQLVDHGWPVGQWVVPVGTVIDGPDPRWVETGLALPLPLPLNAWCCDQDALDLMRQWYHPHLWHLIRFDPHSVKPK